MTDPQMTQPIADGSLRATLPHFLFLQEMAEAARAARYAFGRLETAYTLTSTTDPQKLFNWSDNGAVTVEPGVYAFEALAILTGMGATSGNAAFTFGGTSTLSYRRFIVIGQDTSAPFTSVAGWSGQFCVSAATQASMVTAGTGTGMGFYLSGIFQATAGTVIPQVSLVTAAAAEVASGSFFKLQRMSDGRLFGNWS